VLQNLRFSAWASRFGFGAAICVAVVLAAAAACVILLCFAAESRKSYFSGRLKVANGALAADISQFWRILWQLLCVKVSLCKSLLCVKPSLCKSLLCVKVSPCKSLLCVKVSLCKRLLCVKVSLCKSFSV